MNVVFFIKNGNENLESKFYIISPNAFKIDPLIIKKGNYKYGSKGNAFCYDNENPIKIKNDDKDISNEINNVKNQHVKEPRNEFIDKEIYEKFLMFLQFQEEMKKRN